MKFFFEQIAVVVRTAEYFSEQITPAIRATGVKSVQKNIKPIFKWSSSDWNKQTIFVGLIWLTLHVLDFCINILTGQDIYKKIKYTKC